MPNWSRKESVGLEMRGPGVHYLLGLNLVTGIFCFHVVKPRMPSLTLLPKLCFCKKETRVQ